MQNNAIDVITRGVDIYELILQSQRLQNGRQTHIGNTSLILQRPKLRNQQMDGKHTLATQ